MPARKPQHHRWTQQVMKTSNALDLEPNVFTQDDPRSIAMSLKHSAERSNRRKSEPFRSAMSMLNFYINRAGKNLPKERLKHLEAAKDELRAVWQAQARSNRQELTPGKDARDSQDPREMKDVLGASRSTASSTRGARTRLT